MLTEQLLKSNEALKDLTPAQISAITVLSKNDEDVVIGKKVKEIHDKYDADIKAITGEDKPGGVKSYEHLKATLTKFKKAAEDGADVEKLKGEINTLKSEKANLEKQIREGSNDAALKKKVTDLEKQIGDKDGEIAQLKKTREDETKALNEQLTAEKAKAVNLHVKSGIAEYYRTEGIKFKPSIAKELLNETLQNRESKFMSELKPDWVKDTNGVEQLVFRNENGDIIRDEKTLAPLNAGQLFAPKIADLVDEGKKQPGGGSTPPGGGGGGSTTLDLTGVKTQVEADERIVNHIVKVEGIAKTSPKYGERQTELRNEHKVGDLPIREGEPA